MIIYFTEEDLVSFGYYMVSKERRKFYESHPEFDQDTVEDRLREVNDTDLANWSQLLLMDKQTQDEINNDLRIVN